jgi:hypothetical protein
MDPSLSGMALRSQNDRDILGNHSLEEAGPMAQQRRVLGIDIAKLAIHIVGMVHTGHVVLRKRIGRGILPTFIANLPPRRIGAEVCGSAHTLKPN